MDGGSRRDMTIYFVQNNKVLDSIKYYCPTNYNGASFTQDADLNVNEDIPIMGLPGCVMYAGATVFDLVLPRTMTGEKLTKRDLVKLGHGGLCTGCKPCTYPHCSFGKGE